MKKVVFSLTFVVAICVCAVMTISAGEKENRFTFQTVIFPDDTFTQLLGINDFEVIAGYHGAHVNKGFVFTVPNKFTPEPPLGVYRRKTNSFTTRYASAICRVSPVPNPPIP